MLSRLQFRYREKNQQKLTAKLFRLKKKKNKNGSFSEKSLATIDSVTTCYIMSQHVETCPNMLTSTGETIDDKVIKMTQTNVYYWQFPEIKQRKKCFLSVSNKATRQQDDKARKATFSFHLTRKLLLETKTFCQLELKLELDRAFSLFVPCWQYLYKLK